MNLVRWSPLGLTPTRDLVRMREDMDRFLDGFFATPHRAESGALWAPPVELEESAEEFVVRLDLPGVSQKDVKVQLMGDTLTVRGERRAESTENNGNVLRSERVYGSFERTFTLAAPVHGDRVRATTRDGVLEIRIPKAEEARVREIQIQSE